MNGTVKQIIADKLAKAMMMESLTAIETGKILRINTCYISMIKNPKLWSKCPGVAWQITQKWTNSGLKLREFTGGIVDECWKEINEPRVKVKPEAYQKRIKELKEMVELNITPSENKKIVLDIEINLYINSKKIKLWD